MWNDGFLFTLAALTAIGIWISLGIRRAARAERGRSFDDKVRRFLRRNLFWIVLAIASFILLVHSVSVGIEHGFEWPGVGAILALLVGGVIGSFGARFTWSLFGPRFGSRDPVIGIVIILILIIVYSFPLYREEFSAIWAGLGLRSLKAPGGVELTFTETSPLRSGIWTSTRSAQQEMPNAVSNPSNPQPGLKGLKLAVSDDASSYIVKDDQYIAYFRAQPIPVIDPDQPIIPSDSKLQETLQFLAPGRTLVGCLNEYVKIFPDSELVLVDTKPVIQWFFRLHTYGKHKLYLGKSTSFENTNDLSVEFRHAVDQVRTNILIALGFDRTNRDVASIPDSELSRLRPIAVMGERPTDAAWKSGDEFLVACNRAPLDARRLAPEAMLQILQPYTSIALANLLIAHGSPDQAIIVLAEWLDLWRCARGEEGGPDGLDRDKARRTGPQGPKCEGVLVSKEAQSLDEWLGFRAEFELSIMLYRLAGETSIAYRDFMRNLLGRFQHYLERPITVNGTATEDFSRSISIREEARGCASRQPGNSSSVVGLGADRDVEQVKDIRTALLRLLVADESSVLRSELHFVFDLGIPELENLYEQGILLSKFTPECLDPKNHEQNRERIWVPAVADYQITAGLLALAVADRYQSIAASTDERQRAMEIRAEGKRLIERGYRVLKPIRNREHRDLERYLPLSVQVFTVSSWEESCLLAERALEQLRRASY